MTVIVLFNRDLRVRDHPALWEAVRQADRVVPLFVLDDAILGGPAAAPNRIAFLLESLRDLDRTLRDLGGRLYYRRGAPVREVTELVAATRAEAVFTSADHSSYATGREHRLRRALGRVRLETFPGATVVDPGALRPAGGDHYKVFTPYWRSWSRVRYRRVLPEPPSILVPRSLLVGRLPRLEELLRAPVSPELPPGGETEGRKRMDAWIQDRLGSYASGRDDLPGDATSRLSAYLHLGCLSPLELTHRARSVAGGGDFVRQLCWRDFHHQVLAASPSLPRADYRSRGDSWSGNRRSLAAWKQGRTGYPIVDAGMRQLIREGFMHNRARLIAASFLVKDLYIDWREGAEHFRSLLVDGDIANNSGNWQWVAGTGNDTRPNRVFDPLRQAERFDPEGDYVRRYVQELRGIEGKAVHRPWELPAEVRGSLDYPDPIVDHAAAAGGSWRASSRRDAASLGR